MRARLGLCQARGRGNAVDVLADKTNFEPFVFVLCNIRAVCEGYRVVL